MFSSKSTVIYIPLTDYSTGTHGYTIWRVYDRPKNVWINIARIAKRIGMNKLAEHLSGRKQSEIIGTISDKKTVEYLRNLSPATRILQFKDGLLVK